MESEAVPLAFHMQNINNDQKTLQFTYLCVFVCVPTSFGPSADACARAQHVRALV